MTIIKTDLCLQMEAVECGAASLCILLNYYGQACSLEKVRAACHVNRDGCNAKAIINAAEELGLKLLPLKLSYKHALTSLPFPFIVHWDHCHFLVVEGHRGNEVFLNDPAVGHRTVSKQSFEQSFSELVLLPNNQENVKKNRIRLSIPWQKLSRSSLSFMAFLEGIRKITVVFLLFIFAHFIDHVVVEKKLLLESDYLLHAIVLLVIFLLSSASKLKHFEYNNTVLCQNNQQHFFNRLLQLPVSFFSQRSSRNISDRVLKVEKATESESEASVTLLTLSLWLPFFWICLANLDLKLSIYSLISTALAFYVSSKILKNKSQLNERLTIENNKFINCLELGIDSKETLQLLGSGPNFLSELKALERVSNTIKQSLQQNEKLNQLAVYTIVVLNAVFILYEGLGDLITKQISLGYLISFFIILLLFQRDLFRLLECLATAEERQRNISTFADVYNYERSPVLSPSAPSQIEQGRLVVRSLTFGYDKQNPPLIENLSFTVEPGETAHIVGPVGSGKTTLLRLLCGLLTPWEGQIEIDGKEVKEGQLKGLYFNTEGSKRPISDDIKVLLSEVALNDNIPSPSTTVSVNSSNEFIPGKKIQL